MIIMKFGGTSVGSGHSINNVRRIVEDYRSQQPVVVVSALSGVTNLLTELSLSDHSKATVLINELKTRHNTVVRQLWPEGNHQLDDYIGQTIDQLISESHTLERLAANDRVLSIGEILSSKIVSEYLMLEFPAKQIVATECIKTNGEFGAAEVVDELTRQSVEACVRPLTDSGVVPVITGFIGSTPEDHVTTLGRGGSDYSAALIGHYLKADEVQIWTDVDGVMSADPRVVANSSLIDEMTYEEAAELAAFGAKVLHPKTMRPVVHSSIPLRIANTFNHEAPTTVVHDRVDRSGEVIAIAAKTSVVMVNIYAAEMLLQRGFLSRISAVFASHGISIDIVSATEVSVSITLDNDERLGSAIRELEGFSQVTIYEEVGLVSLIGKDIAFAPSLIAKLFEQLAGSGIGTRMISVGAEGVNISLVIESSSIDDAVKSLHRLFIEGEEV